jgi:hypothetical protein
MGDLQNLMSVLSTMATIIAVVVAGLTIYYSNKNSERQIVVQKLEELFEAIDSLRKFYITLKPLSLDVDRLQNQEDEGLKTRNQYFEIRNGALSDEDWKQIRSYLPRIKILERCYTSGELQREIQRFEDLMFALADYTYNAGSLHKDIHWKDGFPTYEEFFEIVESLEENLISKIK